MDDLRQSGTPFDPFLHATVGDDRNGNPVTVLSTLARLGVDPWEEAAALARLAPDRARQRLADLMARHDDVAVRSGAVAATALRLVALLPQGRPVAPGHPGADLRPDLRPGLGTVLAVVVALLVLARLLLVG
ncbi:MAG: hypothetical protein MUF73_10240 [Rhodobacteraceae bacterium]|nr:hypothetical protein [Paracoccaceae bacterium]